MSTQFTFAHIVPRGPQRLRPKLDFWPPTHHRAIVTSNEQIDDPIFLNINSIARDWKTATVLHKDDSGGGWSPGGKRAFTRWLRWDLRGFNVSPAHWRARVFHLKGFKWHNRDFINGFVRQDG